VDEMLGVSSTHPQLIDIAVISNRALALPRDAHLPIDVQAKQEVESMIVERKMDMLDYRARYLDALMHPFYVENHDAKRVQEQLSAWTHRRGRNYMRLSTPPLHLAPRAALEP
jgi:hypothetical protein